MENIGRSINGFGWMDGFTNHPRSAYFGLPMHRWKGLQTARDKLTSHMEYINHLPEIYRLSIKEGTSNALTM